MTAKEDLFVLIKSLSKTEKAYFKKYTSIHSNEGHKQYLSLFDTINEMNVYEEELLKKNIAHLGIKQLSVYKNYLYKIILRSQVQYTRTHTENHYLDELLLEIEVLMAKNLFSQSTLLIKKAKKIAIQNENYSSLLKVIHYEIRYIKQAPSVKNWAEMYNNATKEEAEALTKLQDIITTRDLNAEMFLFLQSQSSQKEGEEVIQRQANIYQKLQKYSDNYSSAECAINHLSAFVNYYKFTQEPQKAHPYQIKAIAIFEEKPFLIVNEPLRYINSLSNLLILEMMQGDSIAFMDALQKLKTVEAFIPKPLSSPNLQLHIFALSLRHELSFCVKFENFNAGLEVIEQTQKDLLAKANIMNEIFLWQIIYYYARIYFGLNKKQSANHWLQVILQASINAYNKKFHFWAKMLRFLMYWKDENTDFVKSLSKSIRNFAYQYKIDAHLELFLSQKLLELNEVFQEISKEQKAELMAEITQFLSQHKPQEAYFDYKKWWEKEIIGR